MTNSEEIQEARVLPPVLEDIMKSRSLETVINLKIWRQDCLFS